jgi:hypothetical protein
MRHYQGMTMSNWLHDLVLVNDSADESQPGDVSVFRTFTDARSYLEHWGEEPELAVFSGAGEKLLVEADASGNVRISRRESRADGQEIIISWLRRSAETMLAERRRRAGKRWRPVHLGEMEAHGVLPQTVEGLIAYLGFTI